MGNFNLKAIAILLVVVVVASIIANYCTKETISADGKTITKSFGNPFAA